MADEQIIKLADVLVNYSLKLKKDDKFIITASDLALPLVKEVYRKALHVGAHPEISITLPGLQELLFKEGSEEQISYISPREHKVVDEYDVLLFILGGYNTRPLSGVDPQKISMHSLARKELQAKFTKREVAGELRWCATLFPTHSGAQEANLSLDDYEEFVYNALFLYNPDPIQEWKNLSAWQQKICDFLNTTHELHITSTDTDLRMSVTGRKWINCDGTLNLPDGEVFTTPLKESVNGHIRFSYPAIHAGKEVKDVRLTFQNGKVVDAQASIGEDLLLSLLDTDENARYVGEIAIGTNYGIQQFTKNILFDEKLGGTVHLAVGLAFEETGGVNESVIHWDMLCDMKTGGEIRVDDEVIYRNGQFIKDF